VLYKDLLIVTAAAESQALVGLNKKTGEEVWRQEAQGFSGTWGTPVLVTIDDSRTDLVIGVPFEIWGFNPETGKLRWYCEAMETDSYCSSVVAVGQTVYGIEGRNGGSIAVKAGGQGDVKGTHVIWSGSDRARIGTPIVHDGLIYSFSGSALTCLKADSGERVYQARLQATAGGAAEAPGADGGRRGFGGGRGGMGGQDYASPVAADGKIYFQSRSGGVFVVKMGDTFEQLAFNRVTSESEDFSATPAISQGDLFIRSSKHLYCIGTK
jgi:outer membrane protein assembly factor BamB